MKANLFRSILVVFWHFGCYAERLDSLIISVPMEAYEACQKCLLERAGAIHVEEVNEIGNEEYGKKEYWVVGLPNYLRAKLINCFGIKLCLDPAFNNDLETFATEGIDGAFATVASIRPSRKYFVNEQRYWAITRGLPPLHQSNFPLHVNKKREAKHLCVYRHDTSFSYLCEACILTKSDTGSMEIYGIRHRKMSVLYVIHSSDPDGLKNECVKPSICPGTTATLSPNLCNLFKYQVSTRASELPNLVGTISDNIFIKSAYTKNKQRDWNALAEKLEYLKLTPTCLLTTKAIGSGLGSCWGCLLKAYKGMVVLNKVIARLSLKISTSFVLSLFTNGNVNLKICSNRCGDINFDGGCMSETFHVMISAFPNNVFTWIKRIDAAQNNNHVSHFGYSCFLVEHSSAAKGPNCLQCFQGAENWKLSRFTYLFLLKRDAVAVDMLKCFFLHSSCEDVQLMPDIMCRYESGDLMTNFDLNQNLEDDGSGSSAGGTSEPNIVNSAKVMVVEWDKNDPDDAGREAAFRECFICLTRKRKVVLISVIKRYVWMVPSESFPRCHKCYGKVTDGPQFSYNQYLRQVQAEFATTTLSLKPKRERTEILSD